MAALMQKTSLTFYSNICCLQGNIFSRDVHAFFNKKKKKEEKKSHPAHKGITEDEQRTGLAWPPCRPELRCTTMGILTPHTIK